MQFTHNYFETWRRWRNGRKNYWCGYESCSSWTLSIESFTSSPHIFRRLAFRGTEVCVEIWLKKTSVLMQIWHRSSFARYCGGWTNKWAVAYLRIQLIRKILHLNHQMLSSSGQSMPTRSNQTKKSNHFRFESINCVFFPTSATSNHFRSISATRRRNLSTRRYVPWTQTRYNGDMDSVFGNAANCGG